MPIVKLSVLYWAYFSIFGVLFPYAGRYLKSFGFGYEQIGLVMALITGANIGAPFLIARLSDLTGKRVLLARISIIFLFIAVFFFNPDKGLAWTYFMAFAIGISMSMALPQFEAITLGILGDDKHKYSSVRLWGSLGFLSSVWISGQLLETLGIEWFRYLQLGLIVLLFIVTFSIPVEKTSSSHSDAISGSGLEKLFSPTILILFFVLMLNQAALAPYNSFADLYWQQWGLSSFTIGSLLAVAPIAEAALMALIPIILFRYGYFPLLVLSLILGIIRWMVMAWIPDQLSWLITAQIFHAFTFGAMHGTAIYLIGHIFVKSQQGMGQSLYVSLVAGVGLVSGNLVAGSLWKDGSGAEQVFLLAAGACVVSLILTLVALKPSQLKAHLH